MKDSLSTYQTMMSHLEHRFGRGGMLERLAREHPAELATEIVRAALGRGVLTSNEAVELVRIAGLDLQTTLTMLARKGESEGWDAEAIVLDALQGQPH